MSILRSETARLNGAKSKGPKTPEGRRRSSLNALKHGLCSSSAVLSNESQARFNAHRDGYIARFSPADTVELDLVDQLVASSWRLRRALAVESAAYEREMVRRAPECVDFTEDIRLFTAIQSLTDNSRFSAHLSRYEARVHRMYYRALDAIQGLKKHYKTNPRKRKKKTNETLSSRPTRARHNPGQPQPHFPAPLPRPPHQNHQTTAPWG